MAEAQESSGFEKTAIVVFVIGADNIPAYLLLPQVSSSSKTSYSCENEST
jgi:hypothetical protein